MLVTDYELHDIVLMKKPHACGTNSWEITRMGADIRIRCTNCDRVIMMPRFEFTKKLKRILAKAKESDK